VSFFQAKTVELEKLKRENPSAKELEKVESKFRQEEENKNTFLKADL
jgi:hypothetical protein